MSKGYVKINSVTHAIKAKDVLSSSGFHAYLKRYDKAGRKDGCGYQIVTDGDINRAVEILKNNHIKFSDYGEMSEVR